MGCLINQIHLQHTFNFSVDSTLVSMSDPFSSMCILLGNMSLQMEPDGTGWKMQRTGSLQNRPRSEGQKCKYAEKSYKYKYDLGHNCR